jgi:glycosyltransferase involved in cell wall biosynthesis
VQGDPELDTARHALDRWFYRLALAGLRRADAVVAISEYTKRTLVEALGLPEERIEVVYPGVDHERFRPVAVPPAFRARYGLGEEGQTVLYVGSEDPRKNLGTLVQAFARVKAAHPGAKLVKVGAPHVQEGRQKLLAQVKHLGLEEEVLILDSVPDGDLPLFYNAADLLALPSRYEGFGLPVLEAMTCGTPVICSDAASLPEVAGGAAWLVEPGDVDGWAGAIGTLLEDSDRWGELRQAGLERARAFSWAKAGRKMVDVYQGVVRRPGDA